MTVNNLCNSCTNIGCEFQSGIVRTKCAFYMPPHIEPDNCGNYVVMQPIAEYQYEARLKADMVAILDKIRAEIETEYGQCDICEYFVDYDYEENDISEYRPIGNIADILKIIDKYKADKEGD